MSGRKPPRPAKSAAPLFPTEGAFLAGTLLTTSGPGGVQAQVAAEALSPGETLLALSGATEEARPVLAVHRLTLDPADHPNPALVTPIRIRADALAPGMPARDLLLPPEALLRFRDSGPADAPIGPGEDPGYLVPAAALLNGTSITRDSSPGPHTWFIPDLGAHTVLLAESSAVGSARFPAPDRRATPRPPLVPPCAPIRPTGTALNALRTRLAARASDSGIAPPAPQPPQPPEPPPPVTGKPAGDAPPLLVIAAGAPINPSGSPAPLTFLYTLPARTGPIRLRSRPRRAADPAEARRFGVCISGVTLDNTPLAFDSPHFGPGFHPVETDTLTSWRWTNGDAWLVLPYSSEVRQLVISITDWHSALATA